MNIKILSKSKSQLENKNTVILRHGYDERRFSQEQYLQELKARNPKLKVIGYYEGANIKILHQYIACGHASMLEPAYAMSGKSGCKVCRYDRLSKTFSDLRGTNNGWLSYDFYLPTYNTLIEYQGEQHEKSVTLFGGEQQFEKQQEHDRRKREYAKQHNIKLIEIWYYDFDNIEKILESNLIEDSVTTAG